MNTSLNIKRLAPLFLFCFAIVLTTSLFSAYIIALVICINIFFIVCVIDYVKGTSMRKNIGAFVVTMLFALITSLEVLYLKQLIWFSNLF